MPVYDKTEQWKNDDDTLEVQSEKCSVCGNTAFNIGISWDTREEVVRCTKCGAMYHPWGLI